MAGFLKKMVVRSRSPPKSPVKYSNGEFEHWTYPVSNGNYAAPQYYPYAPYGYPPTPYEDYFPRAHQSVSRAVMSTPVPPHSHSEPSGFNPTYLMPSPAPASNGTSTPTFEYSHGDDMRAWPMTTHESQNSFASRLNNFERNEIFGSRQFLDPREHAAPLARGESSRSSEGPRRSELGPIEGRPHKSRHRSYSPNKSPRTSAEGTARKHRSKSPQKKTSLEIVRTQDYLLAQCQSEGCCAAIIVHDTRFLVCKHQLSHESEYFRALFLDNKSLPISGASLHAMNEFAIVVSSFSHPPPATQFKWFLESTIQAPILKDITDDTLETCMRLSKRFRAKGLEIRCARYIQENVHKRTPMVALCWLNWVLKHRFDRATHDACLPCVAMASLVCLEQHRNMITEKLLADLLAAKLRTLYDQAVNVFQTIHSMDHFYVDVDSCPRCGRQKEQGKIRVQASPCRKLLGCERCLKDYRCQIENKGSRELQAFYQCSHGLTALNERTTDCHCQVPLLAAHLARAVVPDEPDPSRIHVT